MESVEEFIDRKNRQFIDETEKMQNIRMKDIGRKGKIKFIREAWTFLPQHNLAKKVFVFERLRKAEYEGELENKDSYKVDDIEYRIGYFIIGAIGRTKGKWVWGQYCPIIPSDDFVPLVQRAMIDKVLLENDIKSLKAPSPKSVDKRIE